MRFSVAAVLAAVPAFVAAANFTVNVGSNSLLTFDPPFMNASIGDMIEFVFQTKNHSVFQSTFTDPCDPMSGGFTSPFFPVNASSPGMPTFLLNVTQDTPIWFYCAQTNPVNHCHSGMVGAINPTPEKTFAAFQATAMGNATSNSTTSNSTTPASSTAGSSTSTSGAPSASNTSAPSTKPSGAGRVVSSGAVLLTFVSVVAGITAL